MKSVNSVMSTAVSDAKTVVPALGEAFKRLVADYKEKTHPKLRLLDNLVLLCMFSFVI